MNLADALKNVSVLAFDTAPIIYFVEANPTYDALVTAIFERVERGNVTGIRKRSGKRLRCFFVQQ
jgi:hypothetical protein